ncbi:DUF2637 domain-containing protein [Streptacidiphilus jeojiensis]|uniref:DUF2637 domain-containing protein n=1 Tax=Streptacidiphilus jeojiensis TaxID=3229225 RepID=UPI0036D336DD
MTNTSAVSEAPHAGGAPRNEEATATIVASVLGLCAFSVSFTHVQTVAVQSGQGGWVADAIAASVELMATAAITEIRRRRRRGQPTGWPRSVLVLGVAMSLASNLATAQPTVWGCVMAAWPQVAFLAVAALIETRTEPVRTGPVRTEPVRTEPVRTGPVRTEPVRTGPVRTEPVQRRGAPGSSAVPRQPRAAREGVREADDGSSEGGGDRRAGTAGRPTRAEVVQMLQAEITADEDWVPDYAELTRATGYGRSWCEKRVGEARRAVEDARAQPFAEAIRTEPPTGTQPSGDEDQDAGALASVTAIPSTPKPARSTTHPPSPGSTRQKARA